jgi:glycosyltransferase involved in cell wall biosynthesis
MRGTDISIVMTVHREGKFLPRTLMSISEAAAFAARAGLTVECVVVFDDVDGPTQSAFARTPLEGVFAVKTIEVHNGCVGLSRNAGCAVAEGEYIFILDGDDLISYSIFPKLMADAQRFGPNAILTPKLLFAFGRTFFTVEYFDGNDIRPEDMVYQHLFNARIFAHSALFQSIAYESVSHKSGYAFEDWHFNCQAMVRGYEFRVTQGTAWFYRQHLTSRNHEAEAITTRQILPSILFEPVVFLRKFPAASARPNWSPAEPRSAHVLSDAVYVDLLSHANRIEPSLFMGNYHWRCIGHFNNLSDGSIGGAYRLLCEFVGTLRFDTIFLVPADRPPPAPVLEAMAHQVGFRRRVVAWCNGAGDASDTLRQIAPMIDILDVGQLFPDLDLGVRDILLLKLMQSSGRQARLHLVACRFAHRFFLRFRSILGALRASYYRVRGEAPGTGGDTASESEIYQFISECIDDLDRVVALEADCALLDQRRLSYGAEKYLVANEQVRRSPNPELASPQDSAKSE